MTVLFTVHRSRFAIIFAVIYSLFSVLLFAPPVLAAEVQPNTFYKNRYPDYVRNLESGTPNEVRDDRFNRRQTELTLLSLGDGMLRPGDKGTALSQISTAIAMLAKKPPVQTGEYIAYMASKAGFIEPAYAQGQRRGGFDILGPIQGIWIATRNVAYLITSLILVVIGFMIMLRKKIDAQTVIGIQQALPKLVVTLLLITFSYAIAGLVIDMIYFLIFFGVKLLGTFGVFKGATAETEVIKQLTTKSLFDVGLGNLLGGIKGVTGATPIETASDAVGNIVEGLMTGVVGEIGGSISGLVAQPIAFVIFAVAILFSLFKLFFALLMAYIQIILSAILGPLQLMLNALPGNDAFSKWFRNLLANAMAFPAATMMIVFAAALMGLHDPPWNISDNIGFADSTRGVNWTAPLIFGEGGGKSNAIDAVSALLGFGILLMTPKVVDMVKEWVQAPEFKYGSAIGEAVGFGGKAPGFLTGAASGEIEYLRGLQKSGGAGGKAYMRSLMFTNPELYRRISDAQAGGLPGRIIHGLRYAVRSGSGK